MACDTISDNAMISASHDDFVTHFCLFAFHMIGPLPAEIKIPVWLRASGCTPYAASANAVISTLPSLSPPSRIPNSSVPLRYFITLSNFCLSVEFATPFDTRPVRWFTAHAISGLVLIDRHYCTT